MEAGRGERLLVPELVLAGGAWRRGWAVLLRAPDPQTGDVAVAWAGPEQEARELPAAEGAEVVLLGGRAVAPGFVNAHSHAFQIALRGRGECYERGMREFTSPPAPGTGGNFWSWREEMYRLVGSIDAAEMKRRCLQAFREMLQAGITCVGEFHYLHHPTEAAGGEPGATEGCTYELDDVVIEAAEEANIRLVLLCTHYDLSGFGGAPVEGPQRRFFSPSADRLVTRLDELHLQATGVPTDAPGVVGGRFGDRRVTFGIAAHSLRATGLPDLISLSAAAISRGLKLHVHLEEQTAEIDACKQNHEGATPMRLLLDSLDEDLTHVTAVHCTHSDPAELAEFVRRGGRVCVCPATEGALGDGIPPLGESEVQQAAAERVAAPRVMAGTTLSGSADCWVCLGTDCNASIDFQAEMRWLEYGQRLRFRRRGVLLDLAPPPEAATREETGAGTAGSVSWQLFQAATLGGARSLGVRAGAVEAGLLADFCVLDLGHPLLREAAGGDAPNLPAERLLDLLAFAGSEAAICAAWVNGREAWGRATGAAAA